MTANTSALNGAVAKLLAGEFTLTRPNTYIAGLRHAKAVAPAGEIDDNRRINDVGRAQCAKVREAFSQLTFDHVFRSPLIRCEDTFVELGGDRDKILYVEELVLRAGLPTRQSGIIDTAYEILGNAGLEAIMKHNEVAGAMNEFAARALSALYEIFCRLPNWAGNARIRILLVGHGWLTPIILHYLAGEKNTAARERLAKSGMGECELIEVGLDENSTPTFSGICG